MAYSNDKFIEKCGAILDYYGVAAQRKKLIKECEELIEATQNEDCDNFIEGLADIGIMLMQMFMSLDEYQ